MELKELFLKRAFKKSEEIPLAKARQIGGSLGQTKKETKAIIEKCRKEGKIRIKKTNMERLFMFLLLGSLTVWAVDTGLERYCPLMIEIYGSCSPELISNYLGLNEKPPDPTNISLSQNLSMDPQAHGLNLSTELLANDTEIGTSSPACGASLSNVVSTTTIKVGKQTITFKACLENLTDTHLVCPGIQIARPIEVISKNITLTNAKLQKIDFNKCILINPRTGNIIEDFNITTRVSP
jgi:hypothetical protein